MYIDTYLKKEKEGYQLDSNSQNITPIEKKKMTDKELRIDK